MKPPLFWTVRREFNGFELMAVTSEKQGARGRYFGRDEHGNATHCRRGETYGRFADAETAKGAIEGINTIRAHYAELTRDLQRQIAELDLSRDRQIADYLRPLNVKLAA